MSDMCIGYIPEDSPLLAKNRMPDDVVRVVRCKDCKHAVYSERWETLECAKREYDFTPDDGYCFMGERRGETDE